MSTAKSLLRLEHASFGYGDQPIIEGASFEIKPGEFLGLVGANGAGKSTLLKGMLRLLLPLHGKVFHAAEIRGHIGYVPQRDHLDPLYPLRAKDVVELGYTSLQPWYHFGQEEAQRAADVSLGQLGLLEEADKPFAELSGGQRQRILIARALTVHPKLLVLDEPLAAIDPETSEGIMTLLSDLNRREGIAIVMVSHLLPALQKRVHRLMTVEEGKLR